MNTANTHTDAINPEMVGEYDAHCFSGGGYFYDQVLEYRVCGDALTVVDIPTGYTHNIENVGTEEMVTVMWANEPFCPQKPDTYFLKV